MPAESQSVKDGQLQCKDCNQWTFLENCLASNRTVSGRLSVCKSCHTKRCQRRCSRNYKAYLRVLARDHIRNNKSDTWNHTKKRRQLKINSSVTADLLVEKWEDQNGLCAITGKTLTHKLGEGRVPTNVTIDRIDCSVGYEEENIRLVCRQANIMKNDLSDEEFLKWCRSCLNLSKGVEEMIKL